MSDKTCIKQIVFGIQFSNSFKLFDKWGEIADKILYSNQAQKWFGEKYYNRISNDAGYQRSLFNDTNQNSLRLTQNNLIITHNIENNFDSSYKFLQEAITKYIFPVIIEAYSLIVRRIGIVFACELNDNEIGKFKRTIINSNCCDSITDFRFSKKETTTPGLIQKDKDNYINKIITVGNLGENERGISYDFQYFFIPPTAEADKKLDALFETAIQSLETDIFKKIGASK